MVRSHETAPNGVLQDRQSARTVPSRCGLQFHQRVECDLNHLRNGFVCSHSPTGCLEITECRSEQKCKRARSLPALVESSSKPCQHRKGRRSGPGSVFRRARVICSSEYACLRDGLLLPTDASANPRTSSHHCASSKLRYGLGGRFDGSLDRWPAVCGDFSGESTANLNLTGQPTCCLGGARNISPKHHHHTVNK